MSAAAPSTSVANPVGSAVAGAVMGVLLYWSVDSRSAGTSGGGARGDAHLDVESIDVPGDGAVGQAHVGDPAAEEVGSVVEDLGDLGAHRSSGDGDGDEFCNRGIRHFLLLRSVFRTGFTIQITFV